MGTEWICVVYLLRIPYLRKRCGVNKIFAFSIRRLSKDGVYSRAAFPIPRSAFEICHVLAFLLSLCFTATVKRILVCYTAVFSVVTQRSSRDDTKNGCVAD